MLLSRARTLWLPCLVAGLALSAHAEIPEAQPFGKTADGEAVEIYTLHNGRGMTVRLMTRGATVVNLLVPDRNGKQADVVFGFDDVAGYESEANQYFGCTVGRVGNRIAKGKFTLDGHEYQLAVNNGPNHLHGGVKRSFDKVVWKAEPFENSEGTGVEFSYTSPDGEEGYPGELKASVRFHLHSDKNQLRIDYSAASSQPTPVNLTNHSYFNLSGEGAKTALDHVFKLHCDKYTPTDDTLIPTGEIKDVAGTPLDFREPRKLGERINELDETANIGYDHNMVVNGEPGQLRAVARVADPVSGRVLEVETTEPGVQFYSGNFLHGQAGKGGKPYPHRSGFCLETQHYPDSVNQPEFPSTILKPGEKYQHACVWSFGVEKK